MRASRIEAGLRPAYKRIDTCAAEFESFTPYMYGTYEKECEADPTPRQKVVILGSGPNRIGQGIEFDYCCCHAAFALREEGFETVMINCNPETVSTDYDTVDRLYFEPLTFEDVSAIIAPRAGVRRRRRLRRAVRRADASEAGAVAAAGRASGSSARHQTRSTWPKTASASRSCCGTSAFRRRRAAPRPRPDDARNVAAKIGFPLVVRPSYVLGGRAMAIVYDMRGARSLHDAAPSRRRPGHPILIDKFLEDAVELDVDAVADSTGAVVIGGIMEHIEEAGIHSGDSSCVVPPYLVAERHVALIRDYTQRIARALKVVGLMNAQFAIKDDTVYVLEVNPRASRTVPYLSKATGVPLAKVAARVMVGRTLAQLGLDRGSRGRRSLRQDAGVPVRAVPGRRHDSRTGDEVHRRSHGRRGDVRVRVRQSAARRRAAAAARRRGLHHRQQSRQAGRRARSRATCATWASGSIATRGTASFLRAHGLDAEIVFKVNEGRPHVGDEILNNRIQLVINTPLGRESFFDDRTVRRIAMMHSVPCITTLTGAAAAVNAIRAHPHRGAEGPRAAGIPRRNCHRPGMTWS